MAIWILDCRDGTTPPGTNQLLERSRNHNTENLSLSKDAEALILEPPLTNDPDDPLNWPYWQRNVALAILCLASFVANAGISVLGPAFVELSAEFQVNFAKLAYLPAWRELAVGISSAVIIPFASIWGKRHQYLLGFILVFAGYIWNGQSSSYESFLGSQIIQGIGQACFQALLGLSVGDLYHVHERGSPLAITTATTFASGFVSPILSGFVVKYLGWRWIFNILAIMTGPILVFLTLFVPETAYRRDRPIFGNGTGGNRDVEDPRDTKSKVTTEEVVSRSRMSFARRLLPVQKRISHQSLMMLITRPFLSLLYPVILWVVLNVCTPLMSIYMMSITIATTFPIPPLNFDPSQIGLMNLAAFVGSVIGLCLCILFSDSLVKRLVKLNNGIYEPEFRLVLAIFQLLTGFCGAYGFGVTASNLQKYGWFWPAFFFALEVASLVNSTMVGSVYIVDGYSYIALEGFAILTVLKCLLSFVAAGSAVKWVEQIGVRPLFTIMAFLQLGFCLTTIPLYIYGKRLRSWCSKVRLLNDGIVNGEV